MITLNLLHVCKERGIPKPFSHLVKNGFTYHTAHRLLNPGLQSINYRHIEKLCLILNCTPNDLLLFQPSTQNPIPDNHPLHQLRHDTSATPVADLMRNIPAHKLNELRETLKNFDHDN